MRNLALARRAAAIVALVAWIGLAVQLRASIGLAGSAGAALWAMFRYFTVIANLIVAVVFTALAAGRAASAALLGGVTLTILLVGVVYAVLLHGLLELSGGAALADLLLHIVVPILVPLWWLAFAPKGGLARRDPLIWAILPLVYFGYGLARGANEGTYPYPFMNPAKLGWHLVLFNAFMLAVGFIAAGNFLIMLDRLLARRT
jgi:hypothetical protein